MDYGKKEIAKRKKDISSKKGKKKKRVGIRVFKAVLICLLIVILIGIGIGAVFVKKVIDNTPVISASDIKPSGSITFVVDEAGNPLDTFFQKGSNRVYKQYDEIPENMGNAFIAIEDERFREHNGIDIQGIIRAGIVGITSGNFSEGASTITQQLIKNNVFPNFTEEKTFYDKLQRKLQEQYLALQIEKQMSKNDILEAYMNTINLGQGCLGVETASRRYFGKDVSELTLSECAVIAGITQSPATYDPIVNPDRNAKRRDVVLNNMLKQKLITQDEYDEAKADPVYERIQSKASEQVIDHPNSYFVDALFKQVIKDLEERKNYTNKQAYDAVYSGGLTIVATQDQRLQQICDEETANPANYPQGTEYGLEYALTVLHEDGTSDNYSKEMLAQYLSTKKSGKYLLDFPSPEAAKEAVEDYKSTLGITDTDVVTESMSINPQPQLSFVIMDQKTGKVKAMVGGRGEKNENLSLNRATDTTRQPGSCFKVLVSYAPALDKAGYTLATQIEDKPFKYDSGQPVKNWDGKYIGHASVRYAIQHSMNVCAVKTLTDIGLKTGFDTLKKFGFTTLVEPGDENYPGQDDIQQSTALGGITRGVKNIEMTAAFAAIANGGEYTEPILYTQVLDNKGEVLLDNKKPSHHKVIKESTAALLTSAMQDVIDKGTGGPAKLKDMPAAGKTGTTEKTQNLWFCGYTPYYTASIWVGYDSGQPMEKIWDKSWHKTLWAKIMNRVHEDKSYKEFEMPSSVKKLTVCADTGLLASSSCSNTYTEYFDKSTAPKKYCPGHRFEPKEDDEDKDDDKDKDKDKDKNDKKDTDNVNTKEPDNNSGNNDTPSAPDPQPVPTPEPSPAPTPDTETE